MPAIVIFTVLAVSLLYAGYFATQQGRAYGENTTGTYTLSNGDTIQYCTTSQCSGVGNQFTNTFTSGQTIYVKVHTTRVSGGTGYLYLYRNNVNAVPPNSGWSARNLTWTQVGSDYYSSITIPSSQSYHFRIYGQIINGGNQVTFEDEIELSTQPNRFMNFYWTGPQPYPPNSADESYTFKSGDVIYVMGYGSALNRNTTYTTNTLKNIVTGGAQSLPMGGYSRTSSYYHRYTLTLPSTGLTDGQWYSVNSRLMYSSTTMIYNMSRMILIDDSAPRVGTDAAIASPTDSSFVKGTVPVTGTADDQFSYYTYVLEYGEGASPASWTTIQTQTNMPAIHDDVLGNWDTTGLTDGQLYTLRLTVTDRAGNPGNQTMVTRQVYVDNNPPVISGVNTSAISSSGATVAWNTDEPANSQVRYGTSPGVYTDTTTLDPAMTTTHSQGLTSLQPSTTYYYQVISTDRGGNISYSSEYSFLTANLTILQLFPSNGADTTFETGQPNWNRGASPSLVAGDSTMPDWGTARSTVRFDLSHIPASATIYSATMSLYQNAQGSAGTINLNLHRVTANWTEGTGNGSATADGATWNTTNGVQSWAAPGGDYVPAAAATAVAPNSTGSWVDWNVTALTQSWVSGTANYGVLLKQDTENPAVDDFKTFGSSEYDADASLRPKLVIEWFGNDTTPPQIGEVRAEDITRTSANIKWSTDENADSQVEYGTTTSYGSVVPATPDPTLVNQHDVPLPGLTEDTVYHYRVISTDRSGNTSTSADYVFQTARLITIQPGPEDGKDSMFESLQPTWNWGGYSQLIVGDYLHSDWGTIRSVLRFDLSQIPSGSTINSATMSLYQNGQVDTSTPALDVHYLTRDWTEGDGTANGNTSGVSWSTYDGTNNWTTAGGDYNPSASASATAPNSSGAWVDWNLTSLAQSWIGGSVTNNGVIVKRNTENLFAWEAKLFTSSDYSTDPSLWPKLTVEYVPAPGTIAITVDETYNRDGTAGGGSVSFGNVNAQTTYDVGDSASPPYAVKLTVKSNSMWELRVAALGDLEQSNPANYIDISALRWKHDSELPAAYRDMTKTPAETIIAGSQAATNGQSFMFDYRLIVPAMATSGNYSVPVVYTAYPE